ncbi:MAG: mannose-1-phosphate guanylyltransferase/mannose-6-phosphate isomerase [Gammaproteobacteria bacterium]
MAVDSLVPVILCGGSGTRLWPLSRGQHPKQFLKLLGERSLFLQTVQRARALPEVSSLVIVGNEGHRFLILDEIAELGSVPAEILLEPVGRNTAPALAVAALHAERARPGALLLALPADHHIADEARFATAIERGRRAAAEGAMVVFGVTPTEPHTGYGYIRKGKRAGSDGLYHVGQFKEKPDRNTAADYVASGEYLWNSGMFLVRADVYLKELAEHAPDIARAAAQAAAGFERDGAFTHMGREAFTACRSESIDYAVMEHTRAGALVELDAGWSDLGSWSSLRDAGKHGAGDNVTHGDVLLDDVSGSVVHSSGRLVAAVGLHDQVVVETPDAVFVAPLERAQDVKQLVAALKARGREEAEYHLRVYRPWGWYEGLVRAPRMQVKRIQVKPGASLSLQLHHHRAEHWVVVSGEAEVTRGEEVFSLHEDQSTYIPQETKHRLSNCSREPLVIIEVQTGSYVGEDDIVRFEDNYGRTHDPSGPAGAK